MSDTITSLRIYYLNHSQLLERVNGIYLIKLEFMTCIAAPNEKEVKKTLYVLLKLLKSLILHNASGVM